MEDQNVNLELTLSLGSTHNSSKTTNNAITERENVPVDAGLDIGAKSRPGGSESTLVTMGRGRPQKYEVGENPLPPATLPPRISIQPDGKEENLGTNHPRDSGKLPILTSSVAFVADRAGGSVTPHVLIVNPGENVVEKIFAFLEKISQADVCIISASGTVSIVLLHTHDVSGCLYRDEGPFDILSLSGPCFIASDTAGGAQTKISLLTVFLAEPDGRIFGGCVNNLLIAATPIKLNLATFDQNMSTDREATRDNNLKVPKLTIEGEPSCRSITKI